MKNTFPINTCRIGDIVDVYKVPHMRKVEIIAINDSGVSIKGPEIALTVISGRTEVTAHDPNITIVKEVKEDVVIDKPKPIKVASIKPPVTSDNKRGSYKDKMQSITLPAKQFTIAQLADHNEIPYPYAMKWAMDNGCVECGKADKAPGTRGRAAIIYKKG